MKELALEGIDGAGKSTVADLLQERLAQDGIVADVCRPYYEARELLGQDLYPLWASDDGSMAAIGTLHTITATARDKAHEAKADLILYDRHWMTAFTEIGDKPQRAAQWDESDFVPTALLRVTPEVAAQRCRQADEAWAQPSELHRYHNQFNALATVYGRHLLGVYRSDDDVSPQCLARNIAWDLQVRR